MHNTVAHRYPWHGLPIVAHTTYGMKDSIGHLTLAAFAPFGNHCLTSLRLSPTLGIRMNRGEIPCMTEDKHDRLRH